MLGRLGVTFALLLATAACRERSTPPPAPTDDAGPAVDPAACEPLADKIIQLYRASAPALGDGGAPSADAPTVRDNAEMVLADCRRAPSRVVPCVATATSVEEIEARCLIPLDDEGLVEARQFGQDE